MRKTDIGWEENPANICLSVICKSFEWGRQVEIRAGSLHAYTGASTPSMGIRRATTT